MLLVAWMLWCVLRCLGVCINALGRLLFIGIWRWVSDTCQSLIGDMCHNLIEGVLRLFLQNTWHRLIGRNVLIFKVTHVSNWLDRLYYRLCASDVIAYTYWCVACVIAYMCILHFYVFISWHLANFYWFLNGDGRN